MPGRLAQIMIHLQPKVLAKINPDVLITSLQTIVWVRFSVWIKLKTPQLYKGSVELSKINWPGVGHLYVVFCLTAVGWPTA